MQPDFSQSFSLAGMVVLVTGAARGIGRAIASRCAQAGAAVFLGDLDEDEGEKVADEIRRLAGSDAAAAFLPLDVTSPESCDAAVRAVTAASPGATRLALVNNAGIGKAGTVVNLGAAELEREWRVNVLGAWLLAERIIPRMLELENGRIVNIASIGGVVGIPERAAYCTTKFAVVGLTKSIALDFGARGITCNAICPARVLTGMAEARIAEAADPAAARKLMEATQIASRMVDPDEVAALAQYLLSSEAAMVNGSTYNIDSAWSAGHMPTV